MTPPHPHPQRALLHNEIHARPPEPMTAPLAISHVTMWCDAAQREASRAHLQALLRDHHLPQLDAQSTHLRADLGSFRVRWELHTEFVSWSFRRVMPGQAQEDAQPDAHALERCRAIAAVPQDWLAGLPGSCLGAMHLWVLPTPDAMDATPPSGLLNEGALVGSTIADGSGAVYTDFMLHPDGYARMVLLSERMPPRRLGRVVQQLLEIDTYRMGALLGLPAARESAAVLGSGERELAELADAIRVAGRDQEPQLLDRLTRLAAQVESHHAATHARFSASAAYFELVDRRIADIGEQRRPNLQTLGEFVDRRLSPARATCVSSVRRQDALSQRVSRISNLLRTRVEIEQQQSSRALLATMNRRQGLQLKLQATVEGLSVAAITYYIVGLVSYLAKGAKEVGWPFSADATAACAIPLVAGGVWWSLRRLHHRVFGE